jgi:predicted dehydrogenase
MSKPALRIAVIGCGYITQAEHVTALFEAAPEVRVAAAVDPSPEHASAIAALFGAPAFVSLEDALAGAEFDAVLIATPPPTHLALLTMAAQAGKHVLMEKPVAYSLAEAEAAMRVIAATNVRCMVAYHRRYDDDCRRVAELVQAGELGEIRAAVSLCRLALPSAYRVRATPPKPAPPSTPEPGQDFKRDWLVENSIHHLNLLRFWLGPATQVHSAIYAASDHNLGILTLSFGQTLVSHHQLRGMECGETISLYGSLRTVHVELWYPHRPYAFPKVVLFDAKDMSRRELIAERANPYSNTLAAFVRCVAAGGTNHSTLEDSIEDLHLLTRIQDVASYQS